MSAGQRDGAGRRLGATLVVSVAAHAAVLLALFAYWAATRPPERDLHRGSYILVSDAPPTPEPPKATRLSPDEPRPQKARRRRPVEQKLASATRPLPTTTEPATDAALPVGPSEPVAVVETTPGADGATDGDDVSWGPVVGDGRLGSVTDPSPECLDERDNDGDRLVDHEDPGCWPELPEEEFVSKQTGAMLLSDMRRDDVMDGDPEELAEQRILSRIRPDGDDLVYQDGSFLARIGPGGEVVFDRDRLANGLRFNLDGPSGPGYLRRKQFLDATEEIRGEREQRSHSRLMKVALARLGTDLNAIWHDRTLSTRQKKTILFDRLEECDLESPGGRKAARIIIDFIRARFRSPGADHPPAASRPAALL